MSGAHTAPFEVVMASAGTGKTFALTNRLAGLLARGVAADRILAATFTRQAAGEIRERLLERIARAAEDAGAAEALSRHAGVSLDTSGWLGVLKRLCRSIHRVRMGTLDSTAQSLARSLAPQLGLVSPWQQAFEHVEEQLRVEVIERLLQELPTAEDRAPLHLLTGREAGMTGDIRLARLLAGSGGQLRRADARAWECLASEAADGPGLDAVREAAARLRSLEAPKNKNGSENKNFTRARETILAAVASGRYDGVLGTKLATGCEIESPTFSRLAVPTDWLVELRTILHGVVRSELAALHERNLAAGALLSRAVELDDEVRRERRAYSLGDLWRMLADCNLDSEQVAYRMDAQFDHVLLDEFQDTSIDQWRVLDPLIDEAVAGGDRDRSVFVVGDVKQSLYGWRNAQAALLPYVACRWPQMKTRPLNETYRCRDTIVQAVNRVFGTLDGNAPLDQHRGAADLFSKRFDDHVSAVPGPGFVRAVDLSVEMEDPKDEDASIVVVADAVARLHGQKADAEVAVLVRRQRVIGRLVAALAARDVPAVSSASASPCDHPAVEAVLAALHLAAHPGDGPSRYAVAIGPLGGGLGLTEWDDRKGAQKLAGELSMRIFEHGIARTVEWLAGLAGASANRRGRERLSDIVSLAEAYDDEPSDFSGIDDFVASVRASRVRPRGEGVVRVLTLHAAKGLQFDAVFLMDLDGPLASHPPSLLADVGGAKADDPTAPPTRISLPGSKGVRDCCPALSAMHERWRKQAVYEELCLLYVGMTRAKAHLEMFVRSSEKGLGAVAWAGLGASDGRWQSGDTGWLGECKAGGTPEREAGPAWARPASVSARQTRPEEPWRIATVRPSEAGAAPGVGWLLSTEAGTADLGTEVHRLLEAVEWIEDAEPDPREWVADAGPLTEEAARRIGEALESGGLAGVLSRSAMERRWGPGLDLSVVRERAISVAMGVDGRPVLVRGRIDRLVLGWSGGRVVRCLIVDFKTGRSAEPGERQLELYRRAVSASLGVPMECVEAELVFTW